jgi:hypothetical protein
MAIDLTAASAQYVDVGVTNIPANNANQSVSCWFFYTVNPTGNQNLIAMMNDPASSGDQVGFRDQGTGEHILSWAFGGSTLVEGTFLPTTDAWHHVVWTWDGTTHSLYVDGVLDNTSTTAPQTATPTAVNIGRWTGGSEYFEGTVDDIRVYDRALSSEEIETMYAALGVDGIVAGLVSRWTMKEGSPGSIASGAGNVKDLAVNANNGEAFASPTYEAGELRFRRRVA